MKHWMRWLLRVFVVAPVFTILAGLAILYGTPRKLIETHGISQFQDATNLKISVSGRMQPVLWPIPGWKLGSIVIENPESADGAQPILTAQDSLLTLAPLGLLQGTLRIGALWLDDAQIVLPALSKDTAHRVLPANAPHLGFLRLRNTKISMEVDQTGNIETLDLDFAALDYAGAKRPVRLQLQGQWRSRQLRAVAKLTSPHRASRGDWVFADVDLTLEDDRAVFKGRVLPEIWSDIPKLAGNVTAEIANPTGMLSWLSDLPPNSTLVNLRDLTLEGRIETLPDRLLLRTRWAGAFHGTRVGLDTTLKGGPGWRETRAGTLNAVSRAGGLYSAYLNGNFAQDQGISGDLTISVLDLPGMFQAQILPDNLRLTHAKSGSAKGRLSATTQGFALSDARLILGSERHTGDAAIDLRGERAVVSLGTSFEQLDVKPWLDPILNGTQPIDRLLPDLDADLVLELNAGSLNYAEFQAGPTVIALSTRPKEVALDLRRMELAGGIVAGKLTADPESRNAKFEISGAEIDSSQILEQLGMTGLSGIAAGSISGILPVNLRERGWQDLQTLGQLSLYQGQFKTLDLDAMAFGPNQSTDFTQADLDFMLRNQAIELSRLNVRENDKTWTASGDVQLATRAISFNVGFADQSNLQRIGGTLDAPEMLPDPTLPIKITQSAEQAVNAASEVALRSQINDATADSGAPETAADEPEASATSASNASVGETAATEPPETGNLQLSTPETVAQSQPGQTPEPAQPETGQEAKATEAEGGPEPDAVRTTGPASSPLPQRARR